MEMERESENRVGRNIHTSVADPGLHLFLRILAEGEAAGIPLEEMAWRAAAIAPVVARAVIDTSLEQLKAEGNSDLEKASWRQKLEVKCETTIQFEKYFVEKFLAAVELMRTDRQRLPN